MTSETNDRNTSILGMWIFLATELLLFSTLLLSLFLYRHLHPEAFAEGSRHLSRFLGSLNTVILLTSSFSMAKAVHASRDPSKNRTVGLSLMITALLGGVFLLIKAFEYYQHYQEGLMPVFHWSPALGSDPSFQLFFFLYFFSTALHALHLFIGCTLCMGIASLTTDSKKMITHSNWIENIGLYWHFVDLVWVFLFPLLYLIGRNG